MIFGISRSSLKYKSIRDDSYLVQELKDLAGRKPGYGARRLHAFLRNRGKKINIKRIRRLCRVHGLRLKTKSRRKRKGKGTGIPCKPEYLHHVWSYDFVHDFCENGRKLKFLTVVEEFTRVCLTVEVGTRFPHQKVIEVLQELFRMFGTPRYLRSDNGPEFIARRLKAWLATNQVETHYISPGSPWENGINERFNGTFRSECLDLEVFYNPDHARALVCLFTRDYNCERPHSSLDYLPPMVFAKGHGFRIPKGWNGYCKTSRSGGSAPSPPGFTALGPPVKKNGREKVSRPA